MMKRHLPVFILIFIFAANVFGQDSTEKDLVKKAEFVIKLIKNTEWPAENAGGNDTFVISVIGQASFVGKLRDLAATDTKLKKTIEIKALSVDDDFSGSNIIFMGENDLSTLAQVLKRIENRPILTITDIDGLARYGVIVELVSDNEGKGKVDFIINKMVMKKAGLNISEDLIKQAKKTYGK
ncbi:MAG: hypothetical protein DRP46_08515 [Candidatus Zixiibacteriota bacterium]|nr:MAG: hypothetical protein DRP46_08515 [candidate division Zixibacteria bacterium]HDL03985.1 YfiR family protein [candidate division Zixibacteria bacterium]